MTKRILVPLDGSALAESALLSGTSLVLALARLASSEITLMRCVPSSAEYPLEEGDRHPDEELSAAIDYLKRVGKRLEENGLKVGIEITGEAPTPTIVDYAEQNPDVWMIAMTTRRHGPSGSWTHASVPEKVLHTTNKPILLVRHPATELPPGDSELEAGELTTSEPTLRTIVVPLDGSARAEQALKPALQLALQSGATLALICAIPPAAGSGDIDQVEQYQLSSDIARAHEAVRMRRYLERIAEHLRTDGLSVRTEIVYGHPAEMILLAARRLHGDLIVMSTRGPQAHQRPWLGSVAQKLLQTSTLPVLLVRSSNRDSA